MIDMERLAELEGDVSVAEMELKCYLERIYPVGSRVKIMLRWGQKNPSLGTVYRHGWNGHVDVEIDNAKPFSRQRFRSVHPRDIAWCSAHEAAL